MIAHQQKMIEWYECPDCPQTTFYWQKVPMLTVSEPPVATMTVPVALFQRMPGAVACGTHT